MSTPISRATFLKGLAAIGLSAAAGKILVERDFFGQGQSTYFRSKIPCQITGPSQKLGHLLRTPQPQIPVVSTEKKKIVIVGGGIAGLAAAWWLKRNKQDFLLLDLENHVGGNSSSGRNELGTFPWGAHYVPIANTESEYVRTLFEELKIIVGYQGGQPLYDELMLCHQPQDRLFKDGAFHDGIVPRRGLQKAESDDIARFFDIVVALRQAKGGDGRPAFAIPVDLSSQDQKYLALDRISMKQWLTDHQFITKPLLWYVDYCCRDDYGSTAEHVSAWAGIHYFAGRRGTSANSEQNAVLTWPQGNGYLVERLRELFVPEIKTGALVTSIEEVAEGKIRTVYRDSSDEKLYALESQYVICATPRFVANRIISGASKAVIQKIPDPTYAPWMVANISLKHLPDGQSQPAWDNVSYYSPSLGYVVANHQEISTRRKPSVITYYFPLSEKEPKAARQALYQATAEQWKKIIVDDLSQMHPGIDEEIISIDLWPWGHGMVRPSIGSLWSERQKMKIPCGNIYFAHSDMSGISNFEEAQYHGVEAARAILARS